MIPCCLSVACDDANALNAFADPGASHVRLRRSTRFLQNQAESTQGDVHPEHHGASRWSNAAPGRPRVSKTPLQLTQRNRANRSGGGHVRQGSTGIEPFMLPADDGEEEEALASSGEANAQEIGDGAVWCTPAQFTQDPRIRRLYGEIHLPRGLQPTCKFPLFNILVSPVP